MMTTTTRRQFTRGACTAFAGYFIFGRFIPTATAGDWSDALAGELKQIEKGSGGRLGVAVLDTGTGAGAGVRADERFPMCSTFKLLAIAALLKRVDDGEERLIRRVRFEARDLVVNSPVTKERVGGEGMTLAELSEAAMTVSDNTAGNLILATIGGPSALTKHARSLGDSVTRLDRWEPDLNEAMPDDPRDTTSPNAMLGNVRALVLGKALSAGSREQLTRWLIGNKTGDARLRAGLPKGWRVGDKTGAGERGTNNAVGVVWPPERAPLLITAYLTGTAAPAERRNGTLAAVGRAVVTAVGL
jgi:beta-lactamase class A